MSGEPHVRIDRGRLADRGSPSQMSEKPSGQRSVLGGHNQRRASRLPGGPGVVLVRRPRGRQSRLEPRRTPGSFAPRCRLDPGRIPCGFGDPRRTGWQHDDRRLPLPLDRRPRDRHGDPERKCAQARSARLDHHRAHLDPHRHRCRQAALAGGKGSLSGRRLVSVAAMLVGALIGAALVIHVRIVFPLVIALIVIAVVAATTWALGRSDPPWARA